MKEKERLLLLFTPPFDHTIKDPGYIKGYVPGIRENGGQYTHAALWTIWAFAELGDCDMTEYLFRLINPIYRADTAEGGKLPGSGVGMITSGSAVASTLSRIGVTVGGRAPVDASWGGFSPRGWRARATVSP